MTWYANQIYARPTTDVIAAFRGQPFLADQLYHVDDLEGVRSQSTREMRFFALHETSFHWRRYRIESAGP